MTKHIDQSLHNLTTIGFSSIFEGRAVYVTINLDEGHYNVHINGELVGEIAFDESKYVWYFTQGDLDDQDLVQEIGERIEAKYN